MLTRVNSSGFGAHGIVHPQFSTHGIACNGAYKRLGRLHCNADLEVNNEGSLGRIGQGFGQCLMKFHWLGFAPDLGFSQININVYVNDLLLGFLCLFLSVNCLLSMPKF